MNEDYLHSIKGKENINKIIIDFLRIQVIGDEKNHRIVGFKCLGKRIYTIVFQYRIGC